MKKFLISTGNGLLIFFGAILLLSFFAGVFYFTSMHFTNTWYGGIFVIIGIILWAIITGLLCTIISLVFGLPLKHEGLEGISFIRGGNKGLLHFPVISIILFPLVGILSIALTAYLISLLRKFLNI